MIESQSEKETLVILERSEESPNSRLQRTLEPLSHCTDGTQPWIAPRAHAYVSQQSTIIISTAERAQADSHNDRVAIRKIKDCHSRAERRIPRLLTPANPRTHFSLHRRPSQLWIVHSHAYVSLQSTVISVPEERKNYSKSHSQMQSSPHRYSSISLRG
jgi:hypothetical protein